MRALLVGMLVAGCAGDNAPPPLDAAGPEGFCDLWVCFDHTLWKLPPSPIRHGACAPNFDGVTEAGTCEYGCRTGTTQQSPELCARPPEPPFACAPPASCTSGATFACADQVGCEFGMSFVTFATCTCDATGAWTCADTCFDGLCGATAVQQAIVGHWEGSAKFFNETYPVKLDIGADGAWRMYDVGPTGEDFGGGGTPGSYISILAQTATGGAGVIAVFEASGNKAILDVRVTADRLRFKIGWDTMCTRFAELDLQR